MSNKTCTNEHSFYLVELKMTQVIFNVTFLRQDESTLKQDRTNVSLRASVLVNREKRARFERKTSTD